MRGKGFYTVDKSPKRGGNPNYGVRNLDLEELLKT